MSAVKAASLHELDDDTPVETNVNGTDVVLVRTEGDVFAISALCSNAPWSVTCTARCSTCTPENP